MPGSDSIFTQAIEDHLALKKQNASLEPTMPIERYHEKVGDPLDRYPGGTVAAGTVADEPIEVDVDEPASGDEPDDDDGSLEAVAADDEIAPLGGMAPSLSLVDDLDRNNALNDTEAAAANLAARTGGPEVLDELPSEGQVVRFPGGAGPREQAAPAPDEAVPGSSDGDLDAGDQTQFLPSLGIEDVIPPAAAGEPVDPPAAADDAHDEVIVIDSESPTPPERADAGDPERARKRRWFGLGGRRKQEAATGPVEEGGWFSDTPRQFSWDD